MNNRIGLLMVLVLFGQTTSSVLIAPRISPQQPRTILSPGDRVQITAQLKNDISKLANAQRFSTERYGQAVAYVRTQAQAVGLDVVTEPVEGVPQWERGTADRCDLLLPDGSTESLRILALTPSAGGEVEGQVVIVNNFFDKDQGPPPRRFDEGNKARIVFFSRELERDRSPNAYSSTVVQRNYGAIWAAKYGAAAVLVRSVQTGNGPVHGGAVGYAPQIPRIPAAALNVEDADKLERLLCHGTRSRDTAELCDGKASVHLKISPNHSPRRQDNVVIRIPGTTLSKEIVLVSAHLDSHDVTPGAADDAAGVATVLAVMREFARNRPRRTILLVLFADEEVNGSGARAFVKHQAKDLSNIVAATEIDDGDGPPRGLQVTAVASQRMAALISLRDLVDRVGEEAAGLELRTDTTTNGADVASLWEEHGIPEVAILQDFTKYFDRHHAANDTPENIDWDGLSQTTFLLLKIVHVLSSGAATPHKASVNSII
jgi:hypothetical protein